MRQLTKTELRRKSELHPDLQLVAEEARKEYDFFYAVGSRGEADQNRAVKLGRSEKPFPTSKHNKSKDPKYKSDAVDVCPVIVDKNQIKLDWENLSAFYKIYQAFQNAAKKLGIKIRSGADFDMDGNLKNDRFRDLPHHELI